MGISSTSRDAIAAAGKIPAVLDWFYNSTGIMPFWAEAGETVDILRKYNDTEQGAVDAFAKWVAENLRSIPNSNMEI